MKNPQDRCKSMPHDLLAEQTVIGAMLLNCKCIPKVQKILAPEDFYREAHTHICEAFFALKSKASVITISEWLARKDLLEKCGGNEYLADLGACVATSAGVEYHAEIIKNLSVRRKLISECMDTADKAYGLHSEVEEILSDHKTALRCIQSDRKTDYLENKDLVQVVFKDIEERAQSGNRFVGVRTGFQNIDTRVNGLEPKTTTYLIARPSMGKTALALNIADFVSLNYPGKVPFFSLESGDRALTRRRLAAHSGVFLSRIRTGDIEDSQWPDLIEAANLLGDNNLIIIDRPRYKVVENLIPLAETLAMDNPLSLIVIDHIQRMRSKKKFQNRHLELSFISEEISSLAKDLNIPILILCQLSRNVEKRKDQRPQLSDMKESGDLEQNADNVWGLYRESKEAEYAYLEGLKGRDIGTWSTCLKFDRFIQKFSDCNEPYKAPIRRDRGIF